MTLPLTSAEHERAARVYWYRLAGAKTYHAAPPSTWGADSWTRSGRYACGRTGAPATFILDPDRTLPRELKVCSQCRKAMAKREHEHERETFCHECGEPIAQAEDEAVWIDPVTTEASTAGVPFHVGCAPAARSTR